jgi:hypothetical protein
MASLTSPAAESAESDAVILTREKRLCRSVNLLDRAGPMREALTSDIAIDEGHLLRNRPGDFLLVVDGDSMIGDGNQPETRCPDVQVKATTTGQH